MKKKFNKIILKFGGCSVSDSKRFKRIADIILANRKKYQHVVVVISAMGNTTNKLIELAKSVSKSPPRRELDMLISVGERISIALLAMALAKRGVKAISFTGSQSGIITCSKHTDAKIIDVRPSRILKELKRDKIVIVAGFQGVSRNKEITTLGRGGSDTSAVALAIALGAEVAFYKDVEGFYSKDPKEDPDAIFYSSLSYDEAISLAGNGATILHDRCIKLAKKNGVFLKLLSFRPSKSRSSRIGEKNRLVKQHIYEE